MNPESILTPGAAHLPVSNGGGKCSWELLAGVISSFLVVHALPPWTLLPNQASFLSILCSHPLPGAFTEVQKTPAQRVLDAHGSVKTLQESWVASTDRDQN